MSLPHAGGATCFALLLAATALLRSYAASLASGTDDLSQASWSCIGEAL